MYGLLALAVSIGGLALLSGKLLVVLGFVLTIATFAFPFGLVLLVAVGVALTCRTVHRPSHWGQPD